MTSSIFQLIRGLATGTSGSRTLPVHLHNYSPDNDQWIQATVSPLAGSPPSIIRLLSWNVDFMAPGVHFRLQSLLEHCQKQSTISPIHVLFLQEVDTSYTRHAYDILKENNWLRENFAATELIPPPYSPGYSTYTFVSKTLLPYLKTSFCLPFTKTHMGRDALVVDFDFGSKGRFRAINVHLESLPGYGEEARRSQLGEVKELLLEADAGLVAGDMNCIRPSDETLPELYGLRDLWHPDDGEGHTWGYQPSCSFPPGRLDKVLVTGSVGGSVAVIGKDVRTPPVMFSDEEGEEIEEEDLGDWVSDHYGLLATIEL